jgi:hypothetical protein
MRQYPRIRVKSTKPIQIRMDKALLRRFDADAEVRRHGRSAVLRRLVADYLNRSRSTRIAQLYRRAYGRDGGLGDEFASWEREGSWPEK